MDGQAEEEALVSLVVQVFWGFSSSCFVYVQQNPETSAKGDDYCAIIDVLDVQVRIKHSFLGDFGISMCSPPQCSH
jgi:hypothetical protein